jgi:uncharacterized membrane protein YhaH (DUF805 family)
MEGIQMGIGLSEIFIVLINVIFILAIPAAIIITAVVLFRRLRDLEARVAKLEGRQISTAERSEKEQ